MSGNRRSARWGPRSLGEWVGRQLGPAGVRVVMAGVGRRHRRRARERAGSPGDRRDAAHLGCGWACGSTAASLRPGASFAASPSHHWGWLADHRRGVGGRCRCWCSPVSFVGRRSRSRSPTTRWSGGWLGLVRPVCWRRRGWWPSLGSWTAITVLLWGLLLALLVCRRVRHLLVVVVAWILQGVHHPVRARPGCCVGRGRSGWSSVPVGRVGDAVRTDGGAWSVSWWGSCMQSGAGGSLAPAGQVDGGRAGGGRRPRPHASRGGGAHRRRSSGSSSEWSRPLLGLSTVRAQRSLPGDVPARAGRPSRRRWRPRGEAIRRALQDQLGLVVDDVEPFGLAGSAGSTPLRIKLQGEPPTWLFGKL